jgi:hypothetical protein
MSGPVKQKVSNGMIALALNLHFPCNLRCPARTRAALFLTKTICALAVLSIAFGYRRHSTLVERLVRLRSLALGLSGTNLAFAENYAGGG